MNRSQLVESIVRNRQEAAQLHEAAQAPALAQERDDRQTERIARLLAAAVSAINQNTAHVRVMNHPRRQEVAGTVSVQEAEEITGALEDLDNSLADGLAALSGELVAAIGKNRTVEVSNHPRPLPFPEFPRRLSADVASMPKYVSEGLDAIRRAIRELDLKVTVQPTPVTHEATDLSPLLDHLIRLQTAVQGLLEKEVPVADPPDFSALEELLRGVVKGVDLVRENTAQVATPTFRSSWEKSFDMRSKDLATTIAYKSSSLAPSDHTRDIVDYIQVLDLGGKTYRRTYSYDIYDHATSFTAWALQ